MKLLIINGPNLDLLGEREPGIYGSESYAGLCEVVAERGREIGAECEFFQSNHEGAIIDCLHDARTKFDGIIINAGAYTHYSYAIRDAIAAIHIPVIEVHISNVHTREEFRHHSVISPVCKGVIAGLGIKSYLCALEYFRA